MGVPVEGLPPAAEASSATGFSGSTALGLGAIMGVGAEGFEGAEVLSLLLLLLKADPEENWMPPYRPPALLDMMREESK